MKELKQRNYIGGKGHAETINWLLNYHEQHQTIEKLIDAKISTLESHLEASVINAFKRFFSNLFSSQ